MKQNLLTHRRQTEVTQQDIIHLTKLRPGEVYMAELGIAPKKHVVQVMNALGILSGQSLTLQDIAWQPQVGKSGIHVASSRHQAVI